MTALLESTTDVRLALGSALHLMKRFDALPREREKTDKVRDWMRCNRSTRCAACEVSFAREVRRFAAHIRALEDGGLTTRDNVVFLCNECHSLFDSGYSSRCEMLNCATEWGKGRSQPIRQVMEERRASFLARQQSVRPAVERSGPLKDAGVYDLVQAGKYLKALNALRQVAMKTKSRSTADLIHIVMAQVHRRRAARGVLPIARTLLENIHVDGLPRKRLPLYYYEYAYVNQLEGRHDQANRFFAESAFCADKLTDAYSEIESVIARSQELATRVIQLPCGAGRRSAQQTLLSFDRLADRASKFRGHFAGRWVLNCLLWKARLLLKIGDCKEACYVCKKAIEFREGLDVTNGWTRLTGITVCGIEGLIVVRTARTPDQVHEGLRLLARALVPLVSGNRQRPEGIRDILLSFEEGLALLGTSRCVAGAAKIATVRSEILDGSSFLDPYRFAA